VKEILVKMINAHQETCSTIIDPTHRKYTIQGLLRVETALHESLKRKNDGKLLPSDRDISIRYGSDDPEL
jgi:hypothetical protein